MRSLWRNGRARWTSNPEVPGSSPGRDDLQAGVSFLLVPFPCQDPICSVYNTPEGLHGEGMAFPGTADGLNIPVLPSSDISPPSSPPSLIPCGISSKQVF